MGTLMPQTKFKLVHIFLIIAFCIKLILNRNMIHSSYRLSYESMMGDSYASKPTNSDKKITVTFVSISKVSEGLECCMKTKKSYGQNN